MNKRKVAALAGLIVLALFISLWAGLMTRSARISVEELLQAWEQGDLPQGLSPPVRSLGEDIIEFGELRTDVRSIRLNSPLDASARVELGLGSASVLVNLDLEFNNWRWGIVGAPETDLRVIINDLPQLALMLEGQEVLTRELEPVGTDKLLTIDADENEWLDQGWQQRPPYFASFYDSQPTPLMVGMNLELYSHNDRLAAAIAPTPFLPTHIRVNIGITGLSGIRHDRVEITSSADWQVTEAVTGRQVTLLPGKVEILPSDKGVLLTGANTQEHFAHRLIFTTADDNRLMLSSITRSGGRLPSYLGSLEVANFGGDLIVVNELLLEQYLYAVLPSEMPASFGPEALAVQAIVARTYAVRNMSASGWRSTSAHVVDSVLSQVYNNFAENSASIAAVEATRGEIVAMDGRPVDVRYYSASSGYTASSHEVWPDGGGFPGTPVPWLTSRPQHPELPGEVESEAVFSDFIRNPLPGAYDAHSPWFRWRVTIPIEILAASAEENLIQTHRSRPASVLKQGDDGKFYPVEILPQAPLGELLDLVPAQRGEGGILMAVDLIGSKGTWRVLQEYYIRLVLRPVGPPDRPVETIRQDGTRLRNFSMLPSAFAVWDLNWDGEDLYSISFFGGGHGHGVGMSQNGVRELVRRGWPRDQIIRHYFPGTEVGNVYE